MRDVEKMIGTVRMTIIYMVSGIGGYLASAVFLPFTPEVGPAGSLYGVLACFIVQIIKEWHFLEQPWILLSKMIGVVTVLFMIGLLPWIDNYAHFLGFVIGFLLSTALIPDFTIGGQPNPTRKMLQIVICLSVVVFLIILLFVILYKVPIYDITFFKYLNCIPLTPDWCANQEIHINRVDVL